MAAQKWTVFFTFLVLITLMEATIAINSEETVVLCKEEKRTIRCLNGGNVKIIHAPYGRVNRHTCISDAMDAIICHAWHSLSLVGSLCDNKPSCELYASNSVFDDPCHGTYKYLYVKFKCIEPPKSITVCESYKSPISCQDGKVIQVVQASYGRQDNTTCPYDMDVTDTNCHAGNSRSIVEATCNFKPSCELYAHNSVFGDPCRATYKYLTVQYQCV